MTLLRLTVLTTFPTIPLLPLLPTLTLILLLASIESILSHVDRTPTRSCCCVGSVRGSPLTGRACERPDAGGKLGEKAPTYFLRVGAFTVAGEAATVALPVQHRDNAGEGRQAFGQRIDRGGIWTLLHGCANARYLLIGEADGFAFVVDAYRNCRSE